MMTKEIPQGELIYTGDKKLLNLYLIMRGTASASYPGGEFTLRSGDVIGLCDADFDTAYIEYQAKEKLSVLAYPYQTGELSQLFASSNDAIRYFFSSFFRQFNTIYGQYKGGKTECKDLHDYIQKVYADYEALCEKYHISPAQPAGYEELSALSLEEDAENWLEGYYATLEQMMTVWDHNKTDRDFGCGFLLRASRDIHKLVTLCEQIGVYKEDTSKYLLGENQLDLLELMLSLYGKVTRIKGGQSEDAQLIKTYIHDILQQVERLGYGNTKLFEERKEQIDQKIEELNQKYMGQKETGDSDNLPLSEVKGSLEKILTYAACDTAITDSFRDHVHQYKETVNKNSTDDAERTLRLKLTKEFYQIYMAAFLKSLRDTEVPTLIKMLFQFGYVDEELAGTENAAYLYKIADHLPTDPEHGVYSYYEWLKAIYEEKKEPSRNEFDLDYGAYLHEQKRMGKITADQEAKLLQSNVSKVIYELENVFPMVNKVTYGRISTFCPLFSEHNIMRDLETSLVTGAKVRDILEGIRKKDYSAYYRETLYSEPDKGVPKEFIHVEVMPDVILAPNAGVRGVMWQEIEGKRRTTPARMLCSIFEMEDLTLLMIRLTGEFRWEMCKRIQGARWNDISERSLTSEYFDYIQFYKKNQDLSSDAKDKIKTDLGRAKNSFKEMFVMDYIVWILYESNGAPRLNKVARGIFFNYCPLSKEIREKLKINPLYREMAERYDIHMKQKHHTFENIVQKLRSLGKTVPEEIQKELEFMEM